MSKLYCINVKVKLENNMHLFVVLAVLQKMDLTAELDKLQNNRALGPPKHKKQVCHTVFVLNLMFVQVKSCVRLSDSDLF